MGQLRLRGKTWREREGSESESEWERKMGQELELMSEKSRLAYIIIHEHICTYKLISFSGGL